MTPPSQTDIDSYVGHMVGHSYSPGYIFLSFAVSFAGAWTALELLHRRTSTRGLYNWYLLLAAACSTGSVAIWSMHFVGNRAIEMADGQPEFQISYNPAFTAASFFLPIGVVGLAFFFFSTAEKVGVFATLLGGLLTGAAVCGMHFMGQLGISNYQPIYVRAYVVGSAIIAVAASTVALSIFFYLRTTWTDSWFKRMACAFLLATSISGMHWVATVGTTYRLKAGMARFENRLSRQVTVVVVLCLALGCCIALLVLALFAQWSRKRAADRAQEVVLASATFDDDGKIMVTPEGLLPCRKITNSYLERSFDDVFNIDHPVFCWIYRVSRCWQSISDLIPAIRGHMQFQSNAKPSRLGTGLPRLVQSTSSNIEDIEDYSLLFKRFFLAAASDLADRMQEPLENIGVLFEDIMSTGTLKKRTKRFFLGLPKHNDLNRVERGSPTDVFGRGQLLFLVRRATKQECIRIQAAGCRFATITNIVDFLARSMEVTREELLPRLEQMQAQAGISHMIDPGVHLAFFGLRPIYQRGFEVLVRSDTRNLLPTVRLALPELKQWHLRTFKRFHNLTINECKAAIEILIGRPIRNRTPNMNSAEETEFLEMLYSTIRDLIEGIPEELRADARLIGRPFRAPCRGSAADSRPGSAFVIAFRSIGNIHDTIMVDKRFVFVPSRLFLCQQLCYRDTLDSKTFARRVHREFAATVNSHKQRNVASDQSRRHSVSLTAFMHKSLGRRRDFPATPSKSWTVARPAGGDLPRSDSSSEKNLVDVTSAQSLGGIHVSNEIRVDVSDPGLRGRSPGVEMESLGNHAEVGVGEIDMDKETWVDELMAHTMDGRRRPEGMTHSRAQQCNRERKEVATRS